MRTTKKIVVLIAPLLLFVVLLVPYSWVNQQVIVEWLGCGCPQLDAYGNMVENRFNANDFTLLFWLFIALCVTVIGACLSRKIWGEKKWLRIAYIVGVFFISLFVAFAFYRMMMWN